MSSSPIQDVCISLQAHRIQHTITIDFARLIDWWIGIEYCKSQYLANMLRSNSVGGSDSRLAGGQYSRNMRYNTP